MSFACGACALGCVDCAEPQCPPQGREGFARAGRWPSAPGAAPRVRGRDGGSGDSPRPSSADAHPAKGLAGRTPAPPRLRSAGFPLQPSPSPPLPDLGGARPDPSGGDGGAARPGPLGPTTWGPSGGSQPLQALPPRARLWGPCEQLARTRRPASPPGPCSHARGSQPGREAADGAPGLRRRPGPGPRRPSESPATAGPARSARRGALAAAAGAPPVIRVIIRLGLQDGAGGALPPLAQGGVGAGPPDRSLSGRSCRASGALGVRSQAAARVWLRPSQPSSQLPAPNFTLPGSGTWGQKHRTSPNLGLSSVKWVRKDPCLQVVVKIHCVKSN